MKIMKTSTLAAFLCVSSAFLSLPAWADQADSVNAQGITSSVTSGSRSNAPKTRAQVHDELVQAQEDGSLRLERSSTYPQLLPYATK